MRLSGTEPFTIELEPGKRNALWQLDQVEAVIIQDAEPRPKEDDFTAFYGQKEVLWVV